MRNRISYTSYKTYVFEKVETYRELKQARGCLTGYCVWYLPNICDGPLQEDALVATFADDVQMLAIVETTK